MIPIPTDYNLGTAYGSIELNASSLSRAASGFDLLGNKMLLIGGAAVAAFGYMVKSAADFEQQMSRFEAVGNATENQMEKIRAKALQLGRDSAYGASEVVKAFTELAYAGATTHEIVSGLGDATVYLAAAGEIPLATAATTLINVLRQFNIDASKSVQVANDIARAANASTISIDDLNTSLRYIGPTAAQMGFSLGEVTKTIAILGNEGIRGSTAGTSLRGVLVGLINTSAPAREAMHTLGLDTNEVGNNFFTAEGKLRNFKEISGILKGALGGLSDQIFDSNGKMKSMKEIEGLLESSTVSLSDKVKLEAFSHIFQRRAMGAAFALAKEGPKAYDDLAKSAQYNTTAQEIMQTKLDNLNGSLKILKASIETFAIVVGEKFTPFFKLMADTLREVVNVFTRLPGPIQTALGLMLAFGGGGLVVVGGMSKIAAVATRTYKGLNDVGEGFKLLKGLLGNFINGIRLMGATLLTSPIFWFVLILGLLILAFYLLYTRSETFRRGLKRLGEIAQQVGRWLKEAFMDVYEWVKANWPDLLLILLGPVGLAIIAWRHFKDQIMSVVNDVIDWLKNNWDIILAILTGPFGLFVLVIRRWGDDIVNFIGKMIDKAIEQLGRLPYYFGYLVGLMIGLAIKLQIELVKLALEMWNKLIELLTDFTVSALKLIIQFFIDLPANFLRGLTLIVNLTIDWVQKMIDLFIQMGFTVLTTVIQFFSQLPGLILDFLTQALNFVIFIAGQVIGAIINMGFTAVSETWNFFSRLPGTIVDAFGDAGSLLFDIGRQIINGLIGGLKSMVDKVTGVVGDIAGGIKSGFGKALSVLSPSRVTFYMGEMVMEGLIRGMKKHQGRLKDTVKQVSAPIVKPGQPGYNEWKLANYGGMAGTQNNRGDTNINIYNPVGEPAEESISRQMQSLAYVGVVG